VSVGFSLGDAADLAHGARLDFYAVSVPDPLCTPTPTPMATMTLTPTQEEWGGGGGCKLRVRANRCRLTLQVAEGRRQGTACSSDSRTLLG